MSTDTLNLEASPKILIHLSHEQIVDEVLIFNVQTTKRGTEYVMNLKYS